MCLDLHVITQYMCHMCLHLLTSLLPEEGDSEEVPAPQTGRDANQDIHPVASDGIVVVMGRVSNPISAS